MKRKKNKNKGILFWITGLSGTGKSTIGNLIYPKIKKKFMDLQLLYMGMILEISGT